MARGVEEFRIFAHGLGHTDTLNRVLQSPFLVAVAPEDDAGVVAVALDQALQQPQVLLVDTHQTVLVDYQDTLSVANVEQGRGHRVVRGTIGITADGLQLFDAPCLQGIGDGSPYTGMILMHVHTLQLQRLSV